MTREFYSFNQGYSDNGFCFANDDEEDARWGKEMHEGKVTWINDRPKLYRKAWEEEYSPEEVQLAYLAVRAGPFISY